MRKTRSPLTRETILQTAQTLLDDQGLAGLSMRKLAAALGVEAMSLYNHIQDKDDLLSGIADLVLSQITLPDASLPWDERLEAFARNLYAALIRHPSVVLILASEQGRPADLKVLRGIDSLIAALVESGLTPEQQVNAYRGLLAMCFGFVFAHTQGLSMSPDQAQASWDADGVSHWNADVLPHLAQLALAFRQTHAQDDFDFMLRAYLNYLHTLSNSQKR